MSHWQTGSNRFALASTVSLTQHNTRVLNDKEWLAEKAGHSEIVRLDTPASLNFTIPVLLQKKSIPALPKVDREPDKIQLPPRQVQITVNIRSTLLRDLPSEIKTNLGLQRIMLKSLLDTLLKSKPTVFCKYIHIYIQSQSKADVYDVETFNTAFNSEAYRILKSIEASARYTFAFDKPRAIINLY